MTSAYNKKHYGIIWIDMVYAHPHAHAHYDLHSVIHTQVQNTNQFFAEISLLLAVTENGLIPHFPHQILSDSLEGFGISTSIVQARPV